MDGYRNRRKIKKIEMDKDRKMNDKETKQNRKEKEETINLSQLLNISGGKNTKELYNEEEVTKIFNRKS